MPLASVQRKGAKPVLTVERPTMVVPDAGLDGHDESM